MGRIPDIYKPAEWRNTTPVDSETNRIGMGFDLCDGTVVRIALSRESAENLAETLRSYLTRTHSDTSSGMLSVEVSNPPEGENVCPLAKSSTACCEEK